MRRPKPAFSPKPARPAISTHENVIQHLRLRLGRTVRVVHGDGVPAGRRPARRHPQRPHRRPEKEARRSRFRSRAPWNTSTRPRSFIATSSRRTCTSTRAGVVKLMDFGIAKTEDLSMTRAGYVLGTPYYMAPEQVKGEKINELVDVYAFGILLFELLTGQKPIAGDTVERIFYSILNEPLDLTPLAHRRPASGGNRSGGRLHRQEACRPAAGFRFDCRNPGTGTRGSRCRHSRAHPGESGARPRAAARPPWLIPGIAVLTRAAWRWVCSSPLRPKPVPPQPPALPKLISTSTGPMVLVPAGEFAFGGDKQRTRPAGVLHRSDRGAECGVRQVLPGDQPPAAGPFPRRTSPIIRWST